MTAGCEIPSRAGNLSTSGPFGRCLVRLAFKSMIRPFGNRCHGGRNRLGSPKQRSSSGIFGNGLGIRSGNLDGGRVSTDPAICRSQLNDGSPRFFRNWDKAPALPA